MKTPVLVVLARSKRFKLFSDDRFRVFLVDDTSAKVLPEDRHKLRIIETWDGSNQNDTELSRVVHHLLVEDLDLEARRRASTERNSTTYDFDDARKFPNAQVVNFEDMPFRKGNAGPRKMDPITFEKGVKVNLIAASGAWKISHDGGIF